MGRVFEGEIKQLVLPQFTVDNYPLHGLSLCVAFRAGFLSFGTIDVWGQIILCDGGPGLCNSRS